MNFRRGAAFAPNPGQRARREIHRDSGHGPDAPSFSYRPDRINTQFSGCGHAGSWLVQAREIQWDYKNIVKRKGRLERLK